MVSIPGLDTSSKPSSGGAGFPHTQSPSASGKDSRSKKDKSGQGWRTCVMLVRGCIAVFGLLVVAMNIQPYIGMVGSMFSEIVDRSLIYFLGNNAVTGGIVRFIAPIGGWVFGTAAWGIFQFLEVMPLFVGRDVNVLRGAISKVGAAHKIPIKPEDDQVLRKLKTKYNNLTSDQIRNAWKYAIIAYIVDFILCFTYFPPISGGIQGIWEFLFMGIPSDINWPNVCWILVNMFCFEFFVGIWMWSEDMMQQYAPKKGVKA